ncbi:MAG: thiol:disulfide interchange protein [Cardiobacteriaceae bacterium]|nr:thiol:disulfide interchange protein [Cardiobacteriaceae bacterium]
MRKLTLSLMLLTTFGYAADFTPTAPPAETQEALLQALKNGRNTAAMVEYIDTIATVPFSTDIYEITFKGENNEVLYVSKDGAYIFQADILAVPNALNITRERREAIAASKGLSVKQETASEKAETSSAANADEPPAKAGKKNGDGQFAALASELALKENKGDGKRRLWIVTAPDCDMCKTLEEQLSEVSDVILYRYLYSGDDATYQRALSISCRPNPNEALRDYLLYGLVSEAQVEESCAKTHGDKLTRIKNETGDGDRAELPVLFFPDGYETRVLPANGSELDSWITMHQLAKNSDETAPAPTTQSTEENNNENSKTTDDSHTVSEDKHIPAHETPVPDGTSEQESNKPPAVKIAAPPSQT